MSRAWTTTCENPNNRWVSLQVTSEVLKVPKAWLDLYLQVAIVWLSPAIFYQDFSSVNQLYTQVNLKWQAGLRSVSPWNTARGWGHCIATLLPRARQVQVLKITFSKMLAQSIHVLAFCLYSWSYGMLISSTRRTRKNVEKKQSKC